MAKAKAQDAETNASTSHLSISHQISSTKREGRRTAALIRDDIPDTLRKALSEHIASNLRTLPAFSKSTFVLSYISIRSEVKTDAIIEDALLSGKTVAVPKTDPHTTTLQWYTIEHISEMDDLETGSFGLREPAALQEHLLPTCRMDHTSIALVPGLIFDREGFRLGYGKGYYDRFLADFPGIKIGLCFEAQLCESLKEMDLIEAHDIKLDHVVTESEIITSCA